MEQLFKYKPINHKVFIVKITNGSYIEYMGLIPRTVLRSSESPSPFRIKRRRSE